MIVCSVGSLQTQGGTGWRHRDGLRCEDNDHVGRGGDMELLLVGTPYVAERTHLQGHTARRRLVFEHSVLLVVREAPQVVVLGRLHRPTVVVELEEVECVEAPAGRRGVPGARVVARAAAVPEVDGGGAPALFAVLRGEGSGGSRVLVGYGRVVGEIEAWESSVGRSLEGPVYLFVRGVIRAFSFPCLRGVVLVVGGLRGAVGGADLKNVFGKLAVVQQRARDMTGSPGKTFDGLAVRSSRKRTIEKGEAPRELSWA